MYQIPLSSLPNQAISFNVDGAYWQLKVYQAISSVCADIYRDGTPVATGVRCFGGIPLMQYSYMYEPNFGNFIFDSEVDWTQFGTECNLYYLGKDEFATLDNFILAGV